MKKIILTVILLGLYCTNSNGQDTCRSNYRITTIPFQYLFNDYSFTFEKVYSNRRTLGLTLGFRPSTKNGGDLDFHTMGLMGYYQDQNFWNPLYNAITIGINSKHYFSKYNNRFIEGNIFYRLWWFDNKNCSYNNVEDESWSGIRTERQNVYGLKLLFGNSIIIRTKIKIKPIIDIYYGVGLRYKTCKFETFNGTFDKLLFLPYNLETKNYWAPSVHLGLRVGLGWKSKGK
jgi:hypothetical protein